MHCRVLLLTQRGDNIFSCCYFDRTSYFPATFVYCVWRGEAGPALGYLAMVCRAFRGVAAAFAPCRRHPPYPSPPLYARTFLMARCVQFHAQQGGRGLPPVDLAASLLETLSKNISDPGELQVCTRCMQVRWWQQLCAPVSVIHPSRHRCCPHQALPPPGAFFRVRV